MAAKCVTARAGYLLAMMRIVGSVETFARGECVRKGPASAHKTCRFVMGPVGRRAILKIIKTIAGRVDMVVASRVCRPHASMQRKSQPEAITHAR